MQRFAIFLVGLLTGLSPMLDAAAGGTASGEPKASSNAPKLQDFALCASSWYEFRQDPTRMNPYAVYFAQNFSRDQTDLAFIPKVKTNLLSMPVERVFPMSAGTGADGGHGFSLVLKANMDSVQKAVEKTLAQRMECGESEGVQLCLLEVNENKTIKIMATENAGGLTTLLGCYYRSSDAPTGE